MPPVPQTSAQEDASIDRLIAQAVEAASKGESIEQLLEVMVNMVSPQARDRLRQKFAAALRKRGLREPAPDADIPSRGAMARIRDLLAVSARQAYDRISAILRARPDLATPIAQAGKILMMHGVVVDRVEVSEADLGTMQPGAGVGQGAGQQRGGRT